MGDISEAGSLHEFLLGLHKQFGPIASFWWGKRYTVSIASAELFEEIEHVFDRPPELFEHFKPLFKPKCMQFANREDGLKRRQHYNKVLSEDAVNKNFLQLQQVANDFVDKWSKMLKEPKIPLTLYTSLFALKSIVHTLLGNIMKDDSKEELACRSEIDEVYDELEISLVKPRTKEREVHVQEEMKDLSKLIKKMLNDRKSNPPNKGEETLLDMIIDYSPDEELQHADVLLFTAGGQTALEYVLTCALYHVATHPEVDSKLYSEIQTVLGDNDVDGTSISNLIYLRQFIDETLRYSIDSPWGARIQDVDITLGGYDIPKTTPVITALGVALKNNEVWPNPDKFDPDRFSIENVQKRPKYWFSPFGVGRRECLAKYFPYAAATVFLVTLLRKFRVHLIDEDQVLIPAYGLLNHQKEEIYINLTPR